MLVHRLAIATLLITGIAWSQGGLANMPSIMPKKITKAEAKVVAVDLEKREMTFYDPERDLKDTYVVRKKTRLRAHKKVFKGKPALEDFLEGDTVKITIIAEEVQLIEVRLMKRAAGG
jgi:intein/homing endonuclease